MYTKGGKSIMLATIRKSEEVYIAEFERSLKHSVEEVWSFLTENEKLKMWFPELSIKELVAGGTIKFDMGNGSFEKMTILEVQPLQVLEYTWDKDVVRFELSSVEDGCKLSLIEKITRLNDHTPRDLAGWHVCLDVIAALLDDTKLDDRKEHWKAWYERYREAIAAL